MQNLNELPTAQEIADLSAFLAGGFAYKTFNIHELRGYLWAVAGAPTHLDHSDWMANIFSCEQDGNGAPEGYNPFNSETEAHHYLPIIFKFYHQCAQQVLDKQLQLPEDYIYSADKQLAAPVESWCNGFLWGYGWLRTVWNNALQQAAKSLTSSEAEKQSFLQQIEIVAKRAYLFLDVPAVLATLKDDGFRQQLIADLPNLYQDFARQMTHYAVLGRAIADVETKPAMQPVVSIKVGRNDPCFCGSGKKYKQCCLH